MLYVLYSIRAEKGNEILMIGGVKVQRVPVAASPRSFDSGRSCSGIRYLTYDVSHRSG